MELLALNGLTRTIARCRPTILSEFSPRYIADALGCDRSDEFFEFFASRDFACFYLDPYRELTEIRDHAELIATHAAAKTRFDWNHIDLVFHPAGTALPRSRARLGYL